MPWGSAQIGTWTHTLPPPPGPGPPSCAALNPLAPAPADRQVKGKVTSEGVFIEALERNPGQYLPEVAEDKLSAHVVKVRGGGGGAGDTPGRGAPAGRGG